MTKMQTLYIKRTINTATYCSFIIDKHIANYSRHTYAIQWDIVPFILGVNQSYLFLYTLQSDQAPPERELYLAYSQIIIRAAFSLYKCF